MIHNSGSCGPKDAPINMGAPINRTQMSGGPNNSHNLNNLPKITQQPLQSSVHYTMPDYSSLGHPPLSISPQTSHFHNYHPMGFQPSYLPPNPNMFHETNSNSVHSDVLPNLNAQNQAVNAHYQNPYEKSSLQDEYKRGNDALQQKSQSAGYKSMPINVPQISTKHHKHAVDNHAQINYNIYNTNQSNLDQYNARDLDLTVKKDSFPQYSHCLSDDTKKDFRQVDDEKNLNYSIKKHSFSHFGDQPSGLAYKKDNSNDCNLDLSIKRNSFANNERNMYSIVKSHEKLIMNDSRRKSLENTVKLIENMLMNSTKNKNLQSNQTTVTNETNLDSNTTNDINIESKPHTQTIMDLKMTNQSGMDTKSICQSSSDAKSPKSEQKSDNDMKTLEEKYCENQSEAQTNLELELDVKPNIETLEQQMEQVSLPIVSVKVEQITSWSDTDCQNPFHRDLNGVMRDDIISCSIIDADNSVDIAMEVVKNGTTSNSYFECPHCNILLMHPKRFLVHYKWHSFGLTNAKRQQLAQERELAKSQRKEAQAAENKESAPPEQRYQCKDCGQVFSVKSSLKSHRQRQHPKRVRECKVCGKCVHGWAAQRAHAQAHAAEAAGEGYACRDCNKRYKHKHSLAKHRDTHLEKTHACSECPKKFGSVTLLKTHMKTHERAQRGPSFSCTYCGKCFYESYSLQIHERFNHRNERPFSCEICHSSFGTNSGLKRHLKVSHSASKPHVCSVCRRSFASAAVCQRHERRAHAPQEMPFACEHCSCRYMKPKDLQRHVHRSHPKGKKRRKSDADAE